MKFNANDINSLPKYKCHKKDIKSLLGSQELDSNVVYFTTLSIIQTVATKDWKVSHN
jgi:hypothetical protein